MQPIDLVLLWHMHQPDYRDYKTGEFTLPWVYLHAIKDYTDMAYHLEKHPHIKVIINYTPILLDQIEDYSEQFIHREIRDPLLRLLATPDLNQIVASERLLIFKSCFLSNHLRMLQPYPMYKRLYEVFQILEKRNKEDDLAYLSGQYLADLLMWYHLAWTGESVRREKQEVASLMAQGENFSHVDRLKLFNLIGELIQGLIPRYRKLADSGQIELSTTPYYHPLSPLLIDFSSARDSESNIILPTETTYPGGRSRVEFHLVSAMESHLKRFGAKPNGVWPAEGAISQSLLDVFTEHGCQWSASSEGVLANSLRKSNPNQLLERNRYLYRPYQVHGSSKNLICFFRDEKLSDMIGFEYAKWFGRDAAEHFIQSIEQIGHNALPNESPIISVILDGENAWEYYPYNGYYFLSDLYELLENHPSICTTTYSSYITSKRCTDMATLPALVAGSWVYGTFSTWIGDRDTNNAWELLCEAKQSFDLVIQSGRLTYEEQIEAERQLSSCESSDWFWWLGDYNPSEIVTSFDKLFRNNLANLYGLLKLPVPAAVLDPISYGGGNPESGGSMRRAST